MYLGSRGIHRSGGDELQEGRLGGEKLVLFYTRAGKLDSEWPASLAVGGKGGVYAKRERKLSWTVFPCPVTTQGFFVALRLRVTGQSGWRSLV